MTGMTVATAPTLSHLPGVELAQTGTWLSSTGWATFSTDDFMAAVAALECPAVRRPCLKLGHVGELGSPGDPAIGYIDNMRGDEDWRTLLGDYAGMPGWLATPDANGDMVIASAFPDRSIEGQWDFRCQMGHTHPFVITAVALLGTQRPAIGTLASLQDVANLYGVGGTPELVAASAAQDAAAHTFTIPVSAGRKDDPRMPNPSARTVAATVSSDDVRRAFYESPIGSDWDAWIEEIQLEPLQIIYIDDDEGARYRVPVTIDAAGDGPDAVTFGDPIQVVIRYEDTAVAASAGGPEPIRFASRSESRPGTKPTAAQAPADQPVTPPTTEEDGSMPDTINKAGLVKALGLADDADEDTILDALDTKLTAAAPPAAVPPEQVAASAGDATELTLLRRELDTANGKIGELVAARAKDDDAAKAERKRAVFASAFTDGKIGGPTDPERVEFEKDYDEAPDVITRLLAARAPGSKFPVRASGYGTDDTTRPDAASGDDYWLTGVRKPVAASMTAGD